MAAFTQPRYAGSPVHHQLCSDGAKAEQQELSGPTGLVIVGVQVLNGASSPPHSVRSASVGG